MNAQKFNKTSGQITITIKMLLVGGKYLLQTVVEDEGCGIKPEAMGCLFQAFGGDQNLMAQAMSGERRGANPQRRRRVIDATHGAGLGLSTSKALVEGHGGTVSAESEVNKFTRITFSIEV